MDKFYKKEKTDKVWWVRTEYVGRLLFSFDKKKVYNLYLDYKKLTKNEKEIFDNENPFWKEFFE